MGSLSRQLRCLGAALGVALLAGCGSGSTFEPLQPSRFIVFGDSMADVGQGGANKRFTVNDGSTNIWALQTAARYGLTVAPSATGGTGYAAVGARVDKGANPISTQIGSFLAASSLGSRDVVLIDAGISEIIALVQDRQGNANGITSDAALNSAAQAAGIALANQVRRLVSAGGKHVVVVNGYDVGRSPYGRTTGIAPAITAALRAFNDSLKISLANVTDSVLLVDAEGYYNPMIIAPSDRLGGGAVSSVPVCNTTTAPIANACTTSTLITSSYNLYVFSDDRHPTPIAHRLFGDFAFDKIKQRW